MPRINDGSELPRTIRIFDSSGREQLAEVIPLDRETARSEISAAWWSAVSDIPKHVLSREHDRNWNWHKLVGTLRTQLGGDGFSWAVSCGGSIQGAILYHLGAESELEPTEPTLLIYRLATAPWNRRWLRDEPKYRGVGSGLLRLAVGHSRRYGTGGRVTVEACSDDLLIEWYERFGFTVAVPDDGEVCILELTPEMAEACFPEEDRTHADEDR